MYAKNGYALTSTASDGAERLSVLVLEYEVSCVLCFTTSER